MGSGKESAVAKFNRVVVPKITSVGAAVVIVGAMFKIMSWPGAGPMLVVGLSVEAFIFLLGVIAPVPPPEKHYEWERVYPELADEGQATKVDSQAANKLAATGALVGLDQMLQEADLSTESFKSFGKGIKTLNESALKMRDMSEAAAASEDYSKNLRAASQSLVTLNKSYASTVEAMAAMANASAQAKEYHAQVQTITKNLGALNAVYEMELKDANSHLKAMNKFYGNLTVAMESMADASKESQLFKDQMSKLTANLTSLNKVYGNMLTAMKG
ncbi:type IX secretion system motor protein PorL/GldL [Rhodoflexus caldus]|uniref:type IX secretion system motor protein PorL/GldL n=1 Tax=Rhodoflexus caldus TaxID=2891236 RepID=UPI00202A5713|nr:gliding motility protein GldL [Rhodoflexus caldus]